MNRRLTDDRFAAALTFAVMIGSTLATGAALFGFDARPAPRAEVGVVHMPAVEVTGRRETAATAALAPAQIAAASSVVRLPAVTITGRRPAAIVAAASAQRISVTTTDGQTCVEVVAPAATAARTAHDA